MPTSTTERFESTVRGSVPPACGRFKFGSLTHAPLLRIAMQPNTANALREPSHVMVDKPSTVLRERLGPVFGRVDDATQLAVNRALAVFLGLA